MVTKFLPIDAKVLTAFTTQKELYVLEIIDYLNADCLGMRLGFGTVYPALNGLEKKGLITSRWHDNPSIRRKCYKLTRSGMRQLANIHTTVKGTVKKKLGHGRYLDCGKKKYKIHLSQGISDSCVGLWMEGEVAWEICHPDGFDAWIRNGSLRVC